jgi:hypothetical protein
MSSSFVRPMESASLKRNSVAHTSLLMNEDTLNHIIIVVAQMKIIFNPSGKQIWDEF